MKELSIEEKAKRYDEAYARMSRAYNDNRCTIGFMNEIFPELKENEDERIRRCLLESIKASKYSSFLGVKKEDCIAWLEKQGEQSKWKPSKDEMDALYGLTYITNKMDDKKDEAVTKLYQDLKREFFNGASYENMFPSSPVNSDINIEKQGEHANFLNKIQIGDKVTRNKDGVLVNLSQLNRVAKKQDEQKSIKTCAEYYNKDRELKMPVLSEFQDKLADILMHREYDGPDETEDDIAKGRLEYELAAIRLSEELLPLAQKEQKPAEWHREDEQNLNACLGYIPDEYLRRWLTDAIHAKYDKPADKVEPKFKADDVMRTHQEAADNITDGLPVVVSIDDTSYHCTNETIDIKDQDNYEYPPINRKQKPWSEEDEINRDLLYNALNQVYDMAHNKDLSTWINKRILLCSQQQEWSEEDEKNIESIESFLCCPSSIPLDLYDTLTNWLNSLKDRVQPKQEWSEEDERMIDTIISDLERHGGKEGSCYSSEINYLKSLKERVQPKQEWSEEDRKKIIELVGIFESAVDGYTANFPYRLLKDYIRILKSCIPQSTWKPSDEQMEAFSYYIKYHIDNDGVFGRQLVKLYQDLLKLREE